MNSQWACWVSDPLPPVSMEESPSDGRGVTVCTDSGTGQLVRVLPVIDSNLKELVKDSIVQRDVMTMELFEICDIKKELLNNGLPDDLSKISSNTPGQWGTHDKDAPGYAESVYNKLCHTPPSDTHDSPAHRDSFPPPAPSPSAQMPPEPLPSRTPSPTYETSIGTPYATIAPGSGELPTGVENKARNSPCKS